MHPRRRSRHLYALAPVLVLALCLGVAGGATAAARPRSAHRGTGDIAPVPMRTFAPGDGKVLVGVSPPNVGQGYHSFLHYVGLSRAALINRFTTPNGDFGWILDEFSRADVTGVISWNFPGNGTQWSIASGRYDAYIRTVATEVRAFGRPLLIRLNWEFNGTWYPWSAVGKNRQHSPGNSPKEYVAAWRHVVNLFRGDLNVSFVWCPAIVGSLRGPSMRLRNWYPGAAYVGWVGLDVYLGSVSWQAMQHGRNALDDDYTFAAQRNRPVMIAEWALSTPGTGDDPSAVSAFLTWMRNHPLVQAQLWFDYNGIDDGGVDHGIGNFPRSAAVLKRAFRSGGFVVTGVALG
ncbi:MAG TPA: glycosyl hydrolase [Acidimicrobiales bacterium]|nr:glycosyl hydrolase [Acidimicrobiales bacterium]